MTWRAFMFRTWPQSSIWFADLYANEDDEISAAQHGARNLTAGAIGGIQFVGQIAEGSLWKPWLSRADLSLYPGVDDLFLVSDKWPGSMNFVRMSQEEAQRMNQDIYDRAVAVERRKHHA